MTNIILLTSQFPYGKGEEFLLAELETIQSMDYTLEIIPSQIVSGDIRDIPHNILVNNGIIKKIKPLRKILCYLSFIMKKEFLNEIIQLVRKKKFFFK